MSFVLSQKTLGISKVAKEGEKLKLLSLRREAEKEGITL